MDSEDGEILVKRLFFDVILVQVLECMLEELLFYMNGIFSEGESLVEMDFSEDMNMILYRLLYFFYLFKYINREDVVRNV